MRLEVLCKDNLKKVIANGDNTQTNVLVVTRDGNYDLIPIHEVEDRNDIAMQHCAIEAYNGLVGPEATKNEKWLDACFNDSLFGFLVYIRTGQVKTLDGQAADYDPKKNVSRHSIQHTMKLNLELDKLDLKGNVLVQLPDGLKPKANEIQEYVQNKFPDVKLTFWSGSCFGACDVPNVSFDQIVQFGHSEWK